MSSKNRSLNVKEFTAKCMNGEFTQLQLLNSKKTLEGNIRDGLKVAESEEKLNAVVAAITSGNYVIQEKKVKKTYSDIVSTLNEFQTEDDFDSIVAGRYLQLKSGAKNRNKEFNLTLLDVRRMVQRKTCFYTRKRFDGSSDHWKRTFERLDPKKGYVKGNVVVCSKWANSLKNTLFEKDNAVLKGCRKELRKFMDTVSSLKVNL